MKPPATTLTSSKGEATEALRSRLASLSPEKRALAEQLLARGAARAAGPPPIHARAGGGPAPLSYAQELLWLIHELTPGTNAYNVSGARVLRGRLDVDALERALAVTVARHDSLRTNFRLISGVPMQVVDPDARVPLRHIDLRDVPPQEREQEVQRIISSEIRHRFDLQSGVLLRFTLIRCAEDEHVLVTVANHIIWDGWSKGVLFRELAVLYDAFLNAHPSPLPEPRLQYADYAVWQRAWLEGAALNRLIGYWREHLAGAPTLLELPTDRPRPRVQTFVGSRQSMYLPGPVLQGLDDLARAESSTRFMILLAAVNVLLHRYSGQDDIVVGTPIANRVRPELEELIGYFTNTLALRTDLSGRPTFRELLHRVRECALGALAHQDAPFSAVVNSLGLERDLSHSPVFQVLFTLQNAAPETLQLIGLSMELLRTDPGTSKFDLSIGMGERWGQLHTSVEYASDLFDPDTISRLRGHLGTLMRGIVADPDRPISALPLLDEEEQRQLVANGRGPMPGPSEDAGTLHGLVEAQADRAPTATAVLDGPRSLTYAELDARANRLAHHLRELGAAPGSFVGLCMTSSLELAVGVLGILKSGAACVPLDPQYPRERLVAMAQRAGLRIMVAQERLMDVVPMVEGARVVRLDGEPGWLDRHPATRLPGDVRATDVAYLIHTSGSTGGPRGVMLTHGGLSNHARAAIPLYGLGPHDRMLQFSSISFDISIEELFPTWAAGAAVVMRSPDTPISGRGFVEFLERSAITVLDLPTAFWHEWVADLHALRAQPPADLRLVIVGGERATPSTLEAWRAIVGERVRWINTYGPTEASVIATAWEPAAAWQPASGVPIGRAIPGVHAYVLDEHMQPVPIGVHGELCIGGAGVAAGYLGQPALTDERFVPDRLSEEPAARLYRTGDIARYRADGNLEFLGRTDDQVKVRGFRIELGEIEAELGKHPELRAAAVTAPELVSGQRRLVGYVVPIAEPGPVPGELRSFLRETLPDYMVPSAYVTLASLPLTPSGKVDRRQLPRVERVELERSEYVPPRDDVELAIAELWREVLGLHEPVGVLDGFFDLGGHSLLAVRLFAEVERRLGVRLPLAELFHDSTLAHLAELVRRERGADGGREWSTLVELRRGEPGRRPLFLFPIVHGEVLLYRELVANLDPDQPVFAFQARGLDGRSAPHRTIEDMATSYVEAIRSVQPRGPYLLGGYCFGGTVAFQAAKVLEDQGEELEPVLLIDAVPFGHDIVPHRVQKESKYLRQLLRSDSRGKLRWFRMRLANLRHNGYNALWLLAFDTWLLTRRPLPRSLQNITRVNGRAKKRFVTPTVDCGAVVFRAGSAEGHISFWTQLARGGVEEVGIDLPGIDHGNIIFEPFVSTLAMQLNARLAELRAMST